MRDKIIVSVILPFFILCLSCGRTQPRQSSFTAEKMIVRIAEIEIEPGFVDEYKAILKYESEESVRLEPGVISIYPMFFKDNPNQIRILEIYSDENAYKEHLNTPHFKHYKEATANMIKSLKLIDMLAIDENSMPQIFRKISMPN